MLTLITPRCWYMLVSERKSCGDGIGDGPGHAEDSLLLAVLSYERAHKASGQGVTRNSGRVRILPWCHSSPLSFIY